jgi:virginiamycin B lyase
MTTGGSLTEYQVPTAPPFQIVAGADGALWFGEGLQVKIGRITTSGRITEYTLHTANLGAVAQGMAKGPFGNVWFTVGKSSGGATATGNQLGRIAPDGTIVGYTVPGSGTVGWMGAGSDTEVWFTYSDGQIWRFKPKA